MCAQIRSSSSARRRRGEPPGNVHVLLAAVTEHAQPVVGLADDVGEVGVREPGPQQQVRVEVGRRRVGLDLPFRRREADDDVGVAALRADELLGVGLAAVELGQHLGGRVPPPRAVAQHLPLAPQALRRVEEDADVEAVADRLGVVSEQALDDQEPARLR